jgi:hypothetical protein
VTGSTSIKSAKSQPDFTLGNVPELWSPQVYFRPDNLNATELGNCSLTIYVHVSPVLTLKDFAFVHRMLCIFLTILKINCDCFPMHHKSIDFCSGDTVRFMRGRNWILKYYLN